MPADTNTNGDIFGGWLLSQMDMAGGILARDNTATRTVTVAMDSVKFLKPVKVGDVVCCYGKVLKIGTTSVTLKIETWVKPLLADITHPEPRFKVTEATFVYVAIDEQRKKTKIVIPADMKKQFCNQDND
jgi:acyl-CoA thioesterase YciA